MWVVERTEVALATAIKAAKDKGAISPTHFRSRVVTAHPSRCGSYLFIQYDCGRYQEQLVICVHLFVVKKGESIYPGAHPLAH
jgi:hypothetical protein